MAKTKATEPKPGLLGSVPKRGRDMIATIMAERGGGLTLIELLTRNWDYETLHRASRTEREVARMFKEMATELAQRHHCSSEQARAALPFLGLTQDLREAVIARRFTLDDPAVLGHGLAVLSRLRWVELALGGEAYADGNNVLEALAVRDTEAAMRLAAGEPAVSKAADGEELEFLDLLTLAVLAAVHGDESALGKVVRRMGTGKPRPWQQGVRQCLTGLVKRDPSEVTGGLTGYLDGLRSLRQKDELEEAITLTAHGLYWLCERADPALVAGFDIAGPLPWDAGFHAWTAAYPNVLAGLNLASISPLLQDVLVGLHSPIS
jgi:hypothetical protein